MSHKVGIEHELVGPIDLAYALLIEHLDERPETEEFVYHGRTVSNHHFRQAGFTLKDETNTLDDSLIPMIELAYEPLTIRDSSDEVLDGMEATLKMLQREGFQGSEAGPVSTQVNYDVSNINTWQMLTLHNLAHATPMVDVRDDRLSFLHEDLFHPEQLHLAPWPLVNDYFISMYCRLSGCNDRSKALRAYTKEDALSDPLIARIVKFQRVKMASCLIWMCPDLPVCKAIESYQFIRSIPALEFREFNQTFNTRGPVNHVLNLVSQISSGATA